MTSFCCSKCGLKAKSVPGGWDIIASPNRPKLRNNTYVLKPFTTKNTCNFCAKEKEPLEK